MVHTGFKSELPIQFEQLQISDAKRIGLVVVDVVNGFCNFGNLAPQSPNPQVQKMIQETVRLTREFSSRSLPVLAFLDTHDAEKPEHPYPPHCLVGSGEDELVPELKWLENDPNTLLMRKDCINAFIGAIQPDGSNVVINWIKRNKIEQMLVVGICTDICVLDFVSTILSARNHGLVSPLEDVIVYSEACSTYDLPVELAQQIGAVPHPQEIAHRIGLYIAAGRGAKLIDQIHFNSAPAFKSNGDLPHRDVHEP